MAPKLAAALTLAAIILALAPTVQAQGKPACNDGQDNDQDGRVDLADPGCEAKNDRDETDASPPPACNDGRDNEGDGRTDYPADPGCASSSDDDETHAAEPTEGEEPCVYVYDDCVPSAGPVLLIGWLEIGCGEVPLPIGHIQAWRDDNGNGLVDRQSDTLLWEWKRHNPICLG